MSKARNIVASRSSMRADAGRPRLTVRLSSAESAIVPLTASTGRLNPRPQCTTAAVKNCPATAAHRINTRARRRTTPRRGRPGLAPAFAGPELVGPERVGDEVISARTVIWSLLEHQMLAIDRR